jgi:two-component system, cell cycle sensor histidine kinase and response regulator CckA
MIDERGISVRSTVYYTPEPAEKSQEASMKGAHEKDLRGSECILIVDDSQSLRDVAEYVLLKLGYKPLLAADGERALELYKEKKEEISLVVLDLIMPGMGGRQCLEELLKADPDARVIVVSGYTDDEPPRVLFEAGASEYVMKPYDMKELTRIIRGVLDRGR